LDTIVSFLYQHLVSKIKHYCGEAHPPSIYRNPHLVWKMEFGEAKTPATMIEGVGEAFSCVELFAIVAEQIALVL
jgi:hypothetical protein